MGGGEGCAAVPWQGGLSSSISMVSLKLKTLFHDVGRADATVMKGHVVESQKMVPAEALSRLFPGLQS